MCVISIQTLPCMFVCLFICLFAEATEEDVYIMPAPRVVQACSLAVQSITQCSLPHYQDDLSSIIAIHSLLTTEDDRRS
jgi:hypothetical protein